MTHLIRTVGNSNIKAIMQYRVTLEFINYVDIDKEIDELLIQMAYLDLSYTHTKVGPLYKNCFCSKSVGISSANQLPSRQNFHAM